MTLTATILLLSLAACGESKPGEANVSPGGAGGGAGSTVSGRGGSPSQTVAGAAGSAGDSAGNDAGGVNAGQGGVAGGGNAGQGGVAGGASGAGAGGTASGGLGNGGSAGSSGNAGSAGLASCDEPVSLETFSPVVKCAWRGPALNDAFPSFNQVRPTPLVGDLPNDSGTAGEIVIVTAAHDSLEGSDGRIRILHGGTCAQEEVIALGPPVDNAASPALADLNNDGTLEIVARLAAPNSNQVEALTWKGGHYTVLWTATGTPESAQVWDGISIADLDNDGKPEVIGRRGEVFNGQSGETISSGGLPIILNSEPVLADVDGNGSVELIANQVFTWNGIAWAFKYPGFNVTKPADSPDFYALADFGTRIDGKTFDHTKRDGIPELVGTGTLGGDESSGRVSVVTLQGEVLLRADLPPSTSADCGGIPNGNRGGPATLADFDGDGMPEIGVSSADAYRVFDLDCPDGAEHCVDSKLDIRWQTPIHDCTSGQSSSVSFDFDGDGSAEVVSADECFVRILSGKTGQTVYSMYRGSATWTEQPIVADPDRSGHARIIVAGSSDFDTYTSCKGSGSEPRSPAPDQPRANGLVDANFAGLRCSSNDDCVSGACVASYCRCISDADCGNDWKPEPNDFNDAESGFVCAAAPPGARGKGNVCRMQHGSPSSSSSAAHWFAGVKVLADRRDRWSSTLPLWNQHAYSVTNVLSNGRVPKTSEWKQNFLDPKLNDFRRAQQGAKASACATP